MRPPAHCNTTGPSSDARMSSTSVGGNSPKDTVASWTSTRRLRGASRRWRDTWRHRRDVDVARDANANNAKRIKGRRKSTFLTGSKTYFWIGPVTVANGASAGARYWPTTGMAFESLGIVR